jgi:hypothetical protein
MISITSKQLHLLNHALGINNKNASPNRNSYCGLINDKDLLDLVSKGLMKGPMHIGKMMPEDNGMFYVTDEGFKFVRGF